MFSKAQPRPSRCPRCKRCRQKKIKCDYIQPRCGPCAKAKVTCEPYKQQFHFIHAEAPLPHDGGRAGGGGGGGDDDRAIMVATSKPYPSRGSGRSQAASWALGPAPEEDEQQQSEWRPAEAGPVTATMAMIGGSQARADAFDQFLRYYLPDGPRLRAHRSSGSWLATARAHRQGFPPLEAAACALGVLTLGRAVGDPGLQRRGLGLYGDALGFARRLMARTAPDDGNWLRVLETVTLLSLFEALATPSKQQRTLSHVTGLAALLRLAGPSAFQEPETHNIFLHMRSAILYTAVLEERSTFLADPRWLSEPWACIPKANISMCLDIVASIPTLLELSNAITDALRRGLDCPHLVDAFDALSAHLRDALDETSTLLPPTTAPPGAPGAGHVHEFAAVQLRRCAALFRHDAIRRVAGGCSARGGGRIAWSGPGPGHHAEEEAWTRLEMELLARAVIADINDFNTEDCGFLTANMLFLPTLAANQFLKRNNGDDEEVMAACRRTASTFIERGFEFFRNYA